MLIHKIIIRNYVPGNLLKPNSLIYAKLKKSWIKPFLYDQLDRCNLIYNTYGENNKFYKIWPKIEIVKEKFINIRTFKFRNCYN